MQLLAKDRGGWDRDNKGCQRQRTTKEGLQGLSRAEMKAARAVDGRTRFEKIVAVGLGS